MAKIRVLIVDDAVLVRKLLSEVLAADPGIEVVGTASNGRLALARLRELNPDLVTLDVEMPEMDGLETLGEIRKTHPRLPVVMFSTLTERGAQVTLDALARGASDYVAKPSGVADMAAAKARVHDDLVPRIKALCRTGERRRPQPASALPATPATTIFPRAQATRLAVPRPATRIDLVAIGCSTGGPNALDRLLGGLPADLGLPVVIVQHMPPMFTRLLAERLDAKCALRVCEARADSLLEPGHVYIAPGDWHMLLKRCDGRLAIALEQSPPENSCRPAVDVLFRSVAQHCGAGTLGIVLTGMGRDGFSGAQQIHEAGGRILAQDEASSVVWGMPGFVAQGGLAEAVLPLERIAGEIVAIVGQGRPHGSRSA